MCVTGSLRARLEGSLWRGTEFRGILCVYFLYVQLQLMAQVYFSVEYPTFHYAVIRCNEYTYGSFKLLCNCYVPVHSQSVVSTNT